MTPSGRALLSGEHMHTAVHTGLLRTCRCECCFDAYFIFLQKNMIYLFKCLKMFFDKSVISKTYSVGYCHG